ncbi:MAG: YqjF family protein [Thermodesulfobacteriota bacterium]
MKPGRFLTAEWRYLAMINYEITPDILMPYVPNKTELDTWNGKTYVSLVGFLFLHTKIIGLPIPFHRNFEDVNLRFYVRRKREEGWRRGVVFVKEIVPKIVIATVARLVYNENYISMPMRHRIELESGSLKKNGSVEYAWQYKGRWNNLRVKTTGDPLSTALGSEEEFITEHYWGYVLQPDGRCTEYQVEHPRWLVWQVSESFVDCNIEELYGKEFVAFLSPKPSSAFLASGSPIIVNKRAKI